MTNKFIRKREKIKAQVKSRFYYLFWGAMARSMNRWFDETIDLIQQPIKPPTGRMMPVPIPTPDYYDNPMIIR